MKTLTSIISILTLILVLAIAAFATNGTITIIKNAIPATGQDFNYITTGPTTGNVVPASFFLDDDSNATLPKSRTWTTHFGTYTFKEIQISHWLLTSLTCTESGGIANTVVDKPHALVTIKLEVGESVTCVYTNSFATAAGANVGGKVIDQEGNGIPYAEVLFYDPWSNSYLTDLTDEKGNYLLVDIPVGVFYFVTVNDDLHTFPVYNRGVNDDAAGWDFQANGFINKIPIVKIPVKNKLL